MEPMMRWLFILASFSLANFSCKAHKKSDSAVKADTSFDSRTGMSDAQDIEIKWTEASAGKLTSVLSNQINMYLKPHICVIKRDQGPDTEFKPYTCISILREKTNSSYQTIGSFPVLIGAKKPIKPLLKDVIKGSMINEAATSLHSTIGYGERGEFFLAFQLVRESKMTFGLWDNAVGLGAISLDAIEPQTPLQISDQSTEAKATVLFTKVAGQVSGATGSRVNWGPYTDLMHDFLYSELNLNATSSVQQNFFNQELDFFNAGFTKLKLATVKKDPSSIKVLEATYSNKDESACLRVKMPADSGPFDDQMVLKSEKVPCEASGQQ